MPYGRVDPGLQVATQEACVGVTVHKGFDYVSLSFFLHLFRMRASSGSPFLPDAPPHAPQPHVLTHSVPETLSLMDGQFFIT